MRGEFEHNELLVGRLDEAFRGIGGMTRKEAFVRNGHIVGFADLLVEIGGRRIVVEAERSARRITRDLLKGMALAADELWIVVPTGRELHAVRRKLIHIGVRVPQPGIYLLTYGQALSRVGTCLLQIAGSYAYGKKAKIAG